MDTPLNPSATTDMPVNTIHILDSGEIISSRDGYEKVEQRFAWADRSACIRRLLLLKALTQKGKKSVIVYYEAGHLVKEYINVETNFQPLPFT